MAKRERKRERKREATSERRLSDAWRTESAEIGFGSRGSSILVCFNFYPFLSIFQ